MASKLGPYTLYEEKQVRMIEGAFEGLPDDQKAHLFLTYINMLVLSKKDNTDVPKAVNLVTEKLASLAGQPDDDLKVSCWFYLALAHHRMGHSEECSTLLSKCFQVVPDYPEAKTLESYRQSLQRYSAAGMAAATIVGFVAGIAIFSDSLPNRLKEVVLTIPACRMAADASDMVDSSLNESKAYGVAVAALIAAAIAIQVKKHLTTEH